MGAMEKKVNQLSKNATISMGHEMKKSVEMSQIQATQRSNTVILREETTQASYL